MKAIELAELVQQMRKAQKEFFTHRCQELLSVAREFERRVDKACDDVLNEQKALFDK